MIADHDPPNRQLGLWTATALVVGHTIGVGVFLTPAAMIQSQRSPGLTIALWLVCATLVFAGSLAFGELAARFPSAGGPYVYLREAWGEQVAFLYGWQCLLVMDTGIAQHPDLGDKVLARVDFVHDGTLLGVIYVDNRLQSGVFYPDDLDLLTAIAASAAATPSVVYMDAMPST